MTRRNLAPYWILTRYGGKCEHCKLGIKKGEQALYFPDTHKLLCAGNECGRQKERELKENAKDAVMYGAIGCGRVKWTAREIAKQQGMTEHEYLYGRGDE